MARGYTKAVNQARHLIYIEDQYLWSPEVAATLAVALQGNPKLHLVAVLPLFPDQDGRISKPPNLVARDAAIATLRAAAPGRVAIYGLENPEGVPVYVHAKVCIIDDQWASVGSDNFNRRSWTHDSELTAAVYHPGYSRELRLDLAREHLDREGPLDDLHDPTSMFTAFADCATQLQAWHDGGRQGARPPGRLRPHLRPRRSAHQTQDATLLLRSPATSDACMPRARRCNAVGGDAEGDSSAQPKPERLLSQRPEFSGLAR